MKATAVQKIFKSITNEDINNIVVCTTTGVKVFAVEEGAWTVDTEDETLCLEDSEGTQWIATDKIVSIEI